MRSKNTARLFAVILSIMIFVTMIPVNTFAEEAAVPAGQTSAGAESEDMTGSAETAASDSETASGQESAETFTPEPEAAETPAAESAETPAAEPAQTPAAELTETPAADVIETPESEPVETPAVEPTETPADTPDDGSTETPEAEPGDTPVPEPIDLQEASDLQITLSATAMTYTGKERRPEVTVLLGGVTLQQDKDYTLAYNNCINAGTATVEITGTGAYTGTVTSDYTIKKAAQKIALSQTGYTKKVGDAGFIIDASITKGDGYLVFTSSNTDAAAVGKRSGKVTVKAPGTTEISVIAAPTDNYKRTEVKVTLTVKKGDQKITVASTSYTKKLSVSSFYIKPTLTKGDGAITFSSSDTEVAAVGKRTGKVVLKKPGMTTITVTAAATEKYKKAKVAITLKVTKGDQKIKVASTGYTKKLNASYFYIKPTLTRGDGTITFTSSDTNVAVVGKRTGKVVLKKPGTTKITVTASATSNYNKAKVTITLKVTKPASSTVSSVTAKGLKKVLVKWKKVTGVTGYQIQYSKSSAFASGNHAVNVAKATQTAATVTMPAGETKYYVRVRTYKTVSGVTTYSAWSPKKAVICKTTLDNWVRLERIGYGEMQKAGDYWYYFDREDDNSGTNIYGIWRMDSKGNTKKLMTLTNSYGDDGIYTNGNYIIVNEQQYHGPVIWRYNMSGSGKTAIVNMSIPEGGYSIYGVYLYGRNLYYSYMQGYDVNQNIYKADILTGTQILHKAGMVYREKFKGRYALVMNESGNWIFDAKTDVCRALCSGPAQVYLVGNEWYCATFSSGTFTITKKAVSGAGTDSTVAVFTPSFYCDEAADVLSIDETGAYFLNDEGCYKYDFAKKQMIKTDLTVWDFVARNMKY